PASLPVTEETRERLRAKANQLGEATVVRLVDLLAVAVEDMRQGGDPRLPLELALVKVTRPGVDLSRESLAYRIEQLEQLRQATPPAEAAERATERHVDEIGGPRTASARATSEPPSLALEPPPQAWTPTTA